MQRFAPQVPFALPTLANLNLDISEDDMASFLESLAEDPATLPSLTRLDLSIAAQAGTHPLNYGGAKNGGQVLDRKTPNDVPHVLLPHWEFYGMKMHIRHIECDRSLPQTEATITGKAHQSYLSTLMLRHVDQIFSEADETWLDEYVQHFACFRSKR